MSGWDNDLYNQDQGMYQQSVGATWSNMNSGAYPSGFVNNNYDFGGQKWEYQNPGKTVEWSTAADDDNYNYNQQQQSSGYNQQEPNFNEQQSNYEQQQLPTGWRNSYEAKSTYDNYYRPKDNRPPRNYRPNEGHRQNQGSRERRRKKEQREQTNEYRYDQRASRSYRQVADEQPRKKSRKRRREERGDSRRKRGRHQQVVKTQAGSSWTEQENYDYKYKGYNYGNKGSYQYQAPQDQFQGKEEEEEEDYYYRNPGYGEWSQIPPSQQPPTWEGQEYEDDTSKYELAYGNGNEGGYEDRKGYYENKRSERGDRRSRHGRDRQKGGHRADNDSPDDKLLYKKHRTLAQDRDGRDFLFRTIRATMHALQSASDQMSLDLKAKLKAAKEEAEPVDLVVPEAEPHIESKDNGADAPTKPKIENNDEKSKEKEKDELPPQVLLGVVRVGPAMKRLLSKEAAHLGAELVLVFKCKPTKTHLHKVADLVKEKMSKQLVDKLLITVNELEEVIVISSIVTDCPYPITIRFTSPLCGKDALPSEEPDPDDVLDEKKCTYALSLIRRIRWVMQKVRNDLETPVVRVLIDITTRVPGWKSLTPYAAEVLVNTVMEKLSKDVRPSEIGIARVFTQTLEVLAGGLALKDGPGLKDPCERDSVDVFADLPDQNAEDLTRAAQNALRMVACEKLHELLDIQPWTEN